MENIFEELRQFGFKDLEQIELFKKPEQVQKEEEKKITAADILYDKSYVCPICHREFKAKAIRSGKNRLLTVDLDLKANYEIVNPIIYDCVVCENCGYAALTKNFNSLTASQVRWIREKICVNYKEVHYPEVLNEQQAVIRYKLALLNSYVKRAKDGEKGYLCLKIAWLYRDLGDKDKEELFLEHALRGFENAYNNERFPIFELGELTTAYIIADIYRRFKDYEKAMRWVGYVIMDRSITLRLKTKALHLKGVISDDKKRNGGSHVE